MACILPLSFVSFFLHPFHPCDLFQGYNPSDKALRTYCQDDTFTVIQLSFLYKLTDPIWDIQQCGAGNCAAVGSDIVYCQSKGKGDRLLAS